MDTSFMLRDAMREFSPDGFSWWDGTTWRASTEIELTPVTEFERSGKLAHARGLMQDRDNAFAATYVVGAVPHAGPLLADGMAVVTMVTQWRGFKEYHEWTLEQLRVATTELFGSEEPMVAGESTLYQPGHFIPGIRRDFAVAVTRAHVVLYQFRSADSPTMRVIFAAQPQQVRLVHYTGIFASNIGVMCGGLRWDLQGLKRIFQPFPVMSAWHAAVAGATAGAVRT